MLNNHELTLFGLYEILLVKAHRNCPSKLSLTFPFRFILLMGSCPPDRKCISRARPIHVVIYGIRCVDGDDDLLTPRKVLTRLKFKLN
jgi:hypothetical protein